MNFFSSLPYEISWQIIEQTHHHDLFACSLVDRKLNQIVKPYLYQHICIKHQDQAIDFLDCISTPGESMGQFIYHVDLQGFTVFDHQLLTLMEHTPLLKSLVIGDGRLMSPDVVQNVPEYWQHLNQLSLTHCFITTAMYRLLLGHLSTLTLWECPGLESGTFSSFHIHNTQLKTLEIATFGDDDDDDDDWNPWMVKETTIDLTGLHGLTHLTIHEPPFGMLYLALMTTDHQYPEFCFPLLTSLSLDGLFDSVDDDILPLLFGFPRLTSLTLKDGAFTDVTLRAIGQYQTDLIQLDMSYCQATTTAGIRHVIRSCRHLSMIKLSYSGFKMNDFPSAGSQCGALVRTLNNTYTALDHLDKQAIDSIRQWDLFG